MTDQPPPPPPVHSKRWVLFVMSAIIGLLVLSMVLVSINERSTQRNADQQSAANEALQQELRCRAAPALAYDKADANLSALIAETLARVGQMTDAEVDERRMAILDAVAEVRLRLTEREESLTSCVVEPD